MGAGAAALLVSAGVGMVTRPMLQEPAPAGMKGSIDHAHQDSNAAFQVPQAMQDAMKAGRKAPPLSEIMNTMPHATDGALKADNKSAGSPNEQAPGSGGETTSLPAERAMPKGTGMTMPPAGMPPASQNAAQPPSLPASDQQKAGVSDTAAHDKSCPLPPPLPRPSGDFTIEQLETMLKMKDIPDQMRTMIQVRLDAMKKQNTK